VGDHILTQGDVRAEGRFEDLVAYGGWTMDDHHPGGMRYAGQPTLFHPAPSPFGISYRSLYSRNVANLFCAGRNISTTHAALSATRVMATCAVCGQAVGTAAAIATREGLDPRGVYVHRLAELQQTLMDDDCYLPWNVRAVPDLTRQAVLTASESDPEPLRNGLDRPIAGVDNGWSGSLPSTPIGLPPGARSGDRAVAAPAAGWVQYAFAGRRRLHELRLVFDSDLDRKGHNSVSNYPLDLRPNAPPATLTRTARVEALDDAGAWRVIARLDENYQRLVRIPVDVVTAAVRLVPEATWGAERAHVFAWDVR
jgi:hypothetical protein